MEPDFSHSSASTIHRSRLISTMFAFSDITAMRERGEGRKERGKERGGESERRRVGEKEGEGCVPRLEHQRR